MPKTKPKPKPAIAERGARLALIQKLQRMTVANGCTPAEAASARRRKQRLLKKNSKEFLTDGADAPKAQQTPKPRRWTGEGATPDEVYRTVADIMAVPDANRTRFVGAIKRTIEGCVKLFERKQKTERKAHDRQALKRLAGAARKLDDAVSQLTEGAVLRLGSASTIVVWRGWCKQRGYDPRGGTDHLTEVDHEDFAAFRRHKGLLALLEFSGHAVDLTREAVRAIGYKPRAPRGHPKGATNQPAYLLAGGLVLAAKDCGGKYTVRPASATGTLVDALECCRLLLPPGFELYSPSSLRGILKRVKERVTNKSK